MENDNMDDQPIHDDMQSSTSEDDLFGYLDAPTEVDSSGTSSQEDDLFGYLGDTPSIVTDSEEGPGYFSKLGSALASGSRETATNLAFAGQAAGAIEPGKALDVLDWVQKSEKFQDDDVDELMGKFAKESRDIGEAWDNGEKLKAVGESADLVGTSLFHMVASPLDTSLAFAEQAGNLAATYLPALALGAAGTATPIPGAGVGGTALGMFSGEALVEFGASVRNQVVEQGGDPTDREAILAVLEDDAAMEDIKANAAKRGITIAGVDLLSNMLGLKLVKGIKRKADGTLDAKSAVGRTAGAGVTEMVGGGVGEGAGSYAEKGSVDWDEIGAEVALGGVTGPLDIGVLGSQLATQKPTATDAEVADLINNAPDNETAIKIAEDIAGEGTIDTTPIVEEVQTIDADSNLAEAPELVNQLPDTISPKGTTFASEQDALAAKQDRLSKYEGSMKAEMETFQPVERIPGQWILERGTGETDVQPEADVKVEPKQGETTTVYDQDGSSYEAQVVEVTEGGTVLVENKNGIQEILDSPDSTLMSAPIDPSTKTDYGIDKQDLTPNGNDGNLEPLTGGDRRSLNYHPKAKRGKSSRGKFAQPYELKVSQMRDISQRYISHIPEDQRVQFVKDFEPKHVVDPVTGFNRTEERDDTMDRVADYLADNPDMQGRAIYVEADISNLGGLNDELGNSAANTPFHDMVNIMYDELDAVGNKIEDFDIVPIRHGGDEVSFILFGVDKKDVDAALKRGEQKVYDYTVSEGLDKLTHAKTNQKNYGTGIISASGIIDPDVDHNTNYSKADEVVEVRKKEVKAERLEGGDERREESTTTRRVQPEARATEGESGVDTRTPGVRKETDSEGQVSKVENTKSENQADIKPKSGTYANKDAAYRALKQKKRNKNLTEEQLDNLADYKPFKSENGYVLRHVDKLPKLIRSQTTKVKPTGATKRTGVTTPELKSAIKDLNKSPEFNIRESQLSEVYTEPKTTSDKKVRQLIEGALGKKVVFFETTNDALGGIGGFVTPSKPGTIYVNVAADKPHLKVMGHELLHVMRRDNPSLYNDTLKALAPLVKDSKGYKNWINSKQVKAGAPALSTDAAVEEMIADLLGDSMGDTTFWTEVEGKSPRLYKKVLDAIQQFLSKYIKSLNTSELKGTGYFKDYIKARSVVANAVKEYKATEDAAAKKAEPKVDDAKSVKFSRDETPNRIPVEDATGIEARIEEMQRKVVDMFQPIRKVQKAIEGTGESLSDAMNIDQALTLFPGNTRAKLDDFMEQQGKAFIDLYHKSGLTWREAAKYLHARHAKEANAVLKARNPELENNEALSGMSDADADVILKKYADRPDVKAIGLMNDRMTKTHIAYQVKEGLLSKSEAEAWIKNSKHYIPLHREMPNGSDGASTGQGFDVRGKASKIRAGSDLEVDYDTMLARIISQHEASIIRASKNKVAKTFYNLAKEYPDDTLWETNVEKFPKSVANLLSSGEISRTVDLQDHNIVSHKVNGENVYMYLNQKNPVANRMVEALRKSNQSVNAGWVNHFAKLTRYLSMMVTSLSPEFVVSNFFRDVQTAAYNLSDTEMTDFTKQIIKDVPNSMKGIRNALRGDGSSTDAALFEQFRSDGGMTGWMDATENLETRMKEIQRDIDGWQVKGKKVPGKKQVESVFEFINDYNTIVENGVRFSAYKQAIKPKSEGGAGLSRSKAAKLAKELTVDFNRKGEWGTVINSFYMFFNASVQGSARLLRASLNPKNKKLHAMMGATVAASAVIDMVNRLTNDDDEYNKLITEQGSRSLVVTDWTGMTDKGYIKIPLPWGYNVLHVAGQEMSAALAYNMGINPSYSTADSVARMFMDVSGAFNPVQEGSIMQTFAPTFMDPIARIEENVDWHGGPLYPNFSPSAPNHTKFYATARQESKDIAKWLYEATVDDDTREAWIDVSPEWLDMGWDWLTGGLGRFVADSQGVARAVISGDSLEMKEIPLGRKVLGTMGPSSKKSNFYDKMYSIVNMDVELERIKEDNSMAEYREARSKVDPKRLQLVGAAKSARKAVNKHKKRIRALEKAGKKDQARKVEKLMLKRMDMYNKLYQKKMYGKEDFTD